MDIKCRFNPYYSSFRQAPQMQQGTQFRGTKKIPLECAEKSLDIFVRRPADAECAAGLLSSKPQILWAKIKSYVKNYVKNIKHTYDHKIVYALVQKELLGSNNIDALTHDADKMILYLLGFPKSFVSEFHRKHSAHHPESGRGMNLTSMLCDNVASSPEFKPEKKRSLREHYTLSPELQRVSGFGALLEQYNYGENLDFDKINRTRNKRYSGIKGFLVGTCKFLLLSIM